MKGGAIQAPLPIVREVVCNECQGEGTVVWQGGPGYFNTSFGNWLPSEGEDICPACGGDGAIPTEFCPICQQPIDDCHCSEEDFAAYYETLDGVPPTIQKAA